MSDMARVGVLARERMGSRAREERAIDISFSDTRRVETLGAVRCNSPHAATVQEVPFPPRILYRPDNGVRSIPMFERNLPALFFFLF